MNLYRTAVFFITLVFANSCSTPLSQQLVKSNPDEEDGIGGTGHTLPQANLFVVGRISHFGSIYVNGTRIRYDSSTPIFVNQAPRKAYDLKIGEVVEVLSKRSFTGVRGLRIHVQHQIVGRVDSMNKTNRLIGILTQKVKLSSEQIKTVNKGQHLAISGFTDAKGIIHASHISAGSRPKTWLLRGHVSKRQGNFYIHNFRLGKGIPNIKTGQNLLLTGRYQGNKPLIQNVSVYSRPGQQKNKVQMLLEGYVTRQAKGKYAIGNIAIGSNNALVKRRLGKFIRVNISQHSIHELPVLKHKKHGRSRNRHKFRHTSERNEDTRDSRKDDKKRRRRRP